MKLKKKKKNIFTIILLFLITLTIIPNYTMATIDTDNYDPTKNSILQDDIAKATDMVNPIINAISIMGIVIAIIALMLIGIKYMLGSVEEKAEYKKTMIPYIVGVVMIVAITQILSFIFKIVTSIQTP